MGYLTSYIYNKKIQLIQIVYPDQTKESLQYDNLGRLIAHTDTKGQITQYKLDIEGRPTEKVNSLGHSLNYEYDAAGRLKSLTNENRENYHFQYNPLDNIKIKTEATNTPDERK